MQRPAVLHYMTPLFAVTAFWYDSTLRWLRLLLVALRGSCLSSRCRLLPFLPSIPTSFLPELPSIVAVVTSAPSSEISTTSLLAARVMRVCRRVGSSGPLRREKSCHFILNILVFLHDSIEKFFIFR